MDGYGVDHLDEIMRHNWRKLAAVDQCEARGSRGSCRWDAADDLTVVDAKLESGGGRVW